MLTESDRKLLTEYLGECWHNWEVVRGGANNELYPVCVRCHAAGHINLLQRTFTSIQDFYDLKEKMVERKEWSNFCKYADDKWMEEWLAEDEYENATFESDYSRWLIHPDRCETVASWLRGGEE